MCIQQHPKGRFLVPFLAAQPTRSCHLEPSRIQVDRSNTDIHLGLQYPFIDSWLFLKLCNMSHLFCVEMMIPFGGLDE